VRVELILMRVCGPTVAAGIAAVGVLIGFDGAAAARPNAHATSVGVSEREFRIAVYRRTVAPGTVRFNVTNFGQDAHDLAVTDRRGNVLAASPEIRSDHRATVAVRLSRPGTYRLLCLKLDHAARGMVTTVVVKGPRP
jgi:plastocyanin